MDVQRKRILLWIIVSFFVDVFLVHMMTSCQAFTMIPLYQQEQQQQCYRLSSSSLLASTNDVSDKLIKNVVNTLDGQEIRQEINAMNNILFVKVKEALSTTMGGILLPDQSKQRPTEGIVIASGPGKLHPNTGTLLPNPISIGMNVVYGQYDGKAVVYNDEECQVIRDDNVLLAYAGGSSSLTVENAIPIRDYVLVELLSPNQQQEKNDNTISTNTGIVLAASVLKDNIPCEGRVIKIGEGRLLPDGITYSKSPVQVNDIIKFKEYAGNDLYIDGKPYSVVKMVDILCTYNNNDV